MIRVNSIRLVMSLEGTAVFLLWLALDSLNILSGLKEKWKRGLLLLPLLFYLFPLPYFRSYLLDLPGLFSLGRPPLAEKYDSLYDEPFLIILQDDAPAFFSTGEKIVRITGAFVFIITFIYLVRRFIAYMHLRATLSGYIKIDLTPKEIEISDILINDLGLRRKILFIKTPQTASPFTTGLSCPSVYLPEKIDLKDPDYQNILRHELAHIRHHDMLVMLLALASLAIHWYNPFNYYYLYKLRSMNERYSDEIAVGARSDKEKLGYCRLLIHFSEQERPFKTDPLQTSFTGSDKKEFKRRIDSIMERRTKKHFIAAVMLGILFIHLGAYTALAYIGPRELVLEKGDACDPEEDITFTTDPIPDEIVLYDNAFIDEEGNISPVGQAETKAACEHRYKNGSVSTHKKSGKGCVINYYHAKKCTKCSKVIKGDLYRSINSKICTH